VTLGVDREASRVSTIATRDKNGEISKKHGCLALMEVQHVAPGRLGFEHWTLRCIKCGLIHEAQAHGDPMKSEPLGWFDGELRAPK
jgi:hypothetical protein